MLGRIEVSDAHVRKSGSRFHHSLMRGHLHRNSLGGTYTVPVPTGSLHHTRGLY